MNVDLPETSLIACICEGGAEIAIMDILLDNNLLRFTRDQLIDEKIIPRNSVKDFEREYLRREYDEKIVILRVIDSRREAFKLSKAYQHQVKKIINVISSPEIEMLIIVNEDRYQDFCKCKGVKPSDYCKSTLKMKNVKQQSFVRDYFTDPQALVESIKKYHGVHKQKNDEASLFDLLK